MGMITNEEAINRHVIIKICLFTPPTSKTSVNTSSFNKSATKVNNRGKISHFITVEYGQYDSRNYGLKESDQTPIFSLKNACFITRQ